MRHRMEALPDCDLADTRSASLREAIPALSESFASSPEDTNTCILQLRIEKQEQRLAGFLIESLDGVAIHSHGKDEHHLRLICNRSRDPELRTFLAAWQRSQSHTSHATQDLIALSDASNDKGDTHHV